MFEEIKEKKRQIQEMKRVLTETINFEYKPGLHDINIVKETVKEDLRKLMRGIDLYGEQPTDYVNKLYNIRHTIDKTQKGERLSGPFVVYAPPANNTFIVLRLLRRETNLKIG